MRKLGVLLLMAGLTLSALWAEKPSKVVMMKGKKVYKGYCMTCHGPDGEGQPGIYPPLAKSDFIKKHDKIYILRAVIFGLSGPIKVNGKRYNGVMNPLPKTYTDKDIAAVATYIYNSWGNPGGVITVEDVKKAKKEGPIKKKGKKKRKKRKK